MRYRIQTLELTEPVPAIHLGHDERGVALVVRRGGRFVGFVLEACARGAVLVPERVRELCAHAERPPSDPHPVTPGNVLPSLTAVVCTRDRPGELRRCLDSLAALAGSPWARIVGLEILVVDNAPTDDANRAIVAERTGVRYVREPRPGLDFARNRAVEEARGAFVAFFDDDVVVDTRWLDGYAEALAAHPDAAAVTGPVIAYELETRAQVVFERWGGFGHRFQKRCFGPTLAGDDCYPCRPGLFGTGCNMALRTEVVRAIGGFDEALDTGPPLPGGGDLDMLYRIVRAGRPIVVEPQCLVFHQHRREWAKLRYQMYTWGLGAMAWIAKSYRTDPEVRPLLRRSVARWLQHSTANVLMCLVGRGGRPVDLALAQLAGGVVGILGEYGRSQRRVARIRARFAEPGPTRGPFRPRAATPWALARRPRPARAARPDAARVPGIESC